MKRGRLGEHRTRHTRKEDRNKSKTVTERLRLRHLEGGDAQAAYSKFCEMSRNPGNSMARNPRKRVVQED
jgi:hypothetical protein